MLLAVQQRPCVPEIARVFGELIEAREDLRDADPLIGWQIVTRAELGIDRGQLGVEARLLEHVFRR